MLLGFVFVVIGLTLYQQRKTERALEALRDLSSPRALVLRGGQQKRIAGRDVVRGDTIVLSEGDRVSADAVMLSPLFDRTWLARSAIQGTILLAIVLAVFAAALYSGHAADNARAVA